MIGQIERIIKVIVLQKDSIRYTLTRYESRFWVDRQEMGIFGASASARFMSPAQGNGLYMDLLDKGFKQFRSLAEVSWYATRPNNTPYEETWKVDGDYLVPVASRVLA